MSAQKMSVHRRLVLYWCLGGLLAVCGCAKVAGHEADVPTRTLVFLNRKPDGKAFRVGVMSDTGEGRRVLSFTKGAEWVNPSPSGNLLLYGAGGSVYRLQVDRGEQAALDLPGLVQQVTWMPDGRSAVVAIRREDDGKPRYEIYLVDAAKGKVYATIPIEVSLLTGLSLTADGRSAVVASPEGLSLVDLTPGKSAGMRKPRLVLRSKFRVIKDVVCSPDGRMATYLAATATEEIPVRVQGSDKPVKALMLVTALRIYDFSTKRDTLVFGPTTGLSGAFWRPDSKAVAFVVSDLTKVQTKVYMGELEAGRWRTREIPVGKGMVSLGGWSRDGKRFTYALTEGGTSTIYICAADGSHPKAISPKDEYDWIPRWLK